MMWMLRAGPFGARRVIWSLLLIDAALGFAYGLDLVVGHRSAPLAGLLDLDAEANLPTWFATVQWFVAAALLAAVADRRVVRTERRSWALWLLPLLALAFSMDETIQLHEFIGVQSDVLLPGETREATMFAETGLLFIVVGVPATIAIGAILAGTGRFLRRPPGALRKLVLGLVAVLVGAIGFDFLANFAARESMAAYVLIYIEESLEMVGATVVVWAALDLAADRTTPA